jgi:hypothetical protein
MTNRQHGRLAVVQIQSDDGTDVLMVEVTLSEDDRITIADQPEVERPLSPHLRMLANELIQAVLEEVKS